MRTMRTLALSLTVATLSLLSCELPGDLADTLPSDRGEGEGEPPDAAIIEDALFDVLECQEIARPSTLERVRDVLHDPTSDEVHALLLNPTDLAMVVAEAGVEVELAVVVLQNLYRIVTDGTLGDVIKNGWDGVSCGEPVVVSCTSGTETTTVMCGANDAVERVDVAFDDCVFDGTLRQGGVALGRGADSTRAVLSFDGLTIDEVERFEGALSVAIETATPRLDASADAASGFSILSHGGVDAEVSCGEEKRVELAHLAVSGDDAVLELDALKVGKDDQWRVRTFGEHLRFSDLSAFDDCRCPDIGAGLEIEVPRPLGDDGAVARARITWAPSEDAELCREARVLLEDWPTDCPGLSGSAAECAEASTERALSSLMGALCARER